MGKKESGGGKKGSQQGSGSSSRGSGMIDIDPSQVRFTHARIRPFFTGCGRRIEDTLADIVDGRISVDDLPKITVLSNDGHIFSLNNRRLFVLKELHARGLLKNGLVQVRIKEALPREKERYTIERCSLTAKIMKERPQAVGEGGVSLETTVANVRCEDDDGESDDNDDNDA